MGTSWAVLSLLDYADYRGWEFSSLDAQPLWLMNCAAVAKLGKSVMRGNNATLCLEACRFPETKSSLIMSIAVLQNLYHVLLDCRPISNSALPTQSDTHSD